MELEDIKVVRLTASGLVSDSPVYVVSANIDGTGKPYGYCIFYNGYSDYDKRQWYVGCNGGKSTYRELIRPYFFNNGLYVYLYGDSVIIRLCEVY